MKNKMVILIAFDLKNAFNGVNGKILDVRLKEKGIPIKIKNWIRNFMEDRSANIKFNDFETDVALIINAGLI